MQVEPFRKRDPLRLLCERFAANAWLRETLAAIERRIDAAVASAEAAPFAETPGRPRAAAAPAVWRRASFEKDRVLASIRGALDRALAGEPRMIVIGEDIESPYGGAFKATQGLSDTHRGRVRQPRVAPQGLSWVRRGVSISDLP